MNHVQKVPSTSTSLKLVLLSYCASFSASHYIFSMWQSSVSFDGLVTWVHSFPPWQGRVPWPRNHYRYFCQASILTICACAQGCDDAGAYAAVLSRRWGRTSRQFITRPRQGDKRVICAGCISLDCDREPTRPPGQHSTRSLILDACGELAVLATAAACCSYKHAWLF